MKEIVGEFKGIPIKRYEYKDKYVYLRTDTDEVFFIADKNKPLEEILKHERINLS